MPACPSCATENPDIAKFCLACGTALAPVPRPCASCGTENPDVARFCLGCGSPLDSAAAAVAAAPPAPPRETRKVVSIVFSDLKGSTSLGERLDSEALREVMSRYFDAMSAELERHGGTIEKFIGDAVMAVFGLPHLHEDDALRAVRAAVGMQDALTRLNEELERFYGVRLVNRTGVNTGQVVAADGATDQRLVTGDVVNVAARLEQAAGACEVLIGELTYRLVRDAVEVEPVEPLELKGKSERVPAYRLMGLREAGAAVPARAFAMVGRDDELRMLAEEVDAALASRSCRLVTIVGEAGAGKSRLTAEFLAGIADRAVVLRGRCLPYGDGITFWPLSEAVREGAGIVTEDAADVAYGKLEALAGADGGEVVERVAAAIGLRPAPFAVDEIFWAARRLLEHLARERLLVVVFEDIHWAEQTFLDLLDHLVAGVENAPVVVMCPSRPELLEVRRDWAERPSVTLLELAALTDEQSGRLVGNLLGDADLSVEVRDRIVEAAEGNPLFVEQLLSMLIDDGVIRSDGNRWSVVGELDQLRVPPTIQALLAARLDALDGRERGVVQPASVVGYLFPRDAVEHLVAEEIRPGLDGGLESLTRKQLVQRSPDAPDAYRFHHMLIRDTAYDGILKRARASLHERFVQWADGVNRDRATEFEEILGYHLEQAWTYLSELGPLGERGLAIGADGARRLASAGRRAFERGDAPAAANLLGRAAALLPEDDPSRLELLADRAEALLQEGAFEPAMAVVDNGLEAARRAGNESAAQKLALVRLLVELRTGGEDGWSERVERETALAIEVFEPLGDHAGLAKAWRLRSWSSGIACRFADTAAAAERALEHASLAGDTRQARRSTTSYGAAIVFGPTPVAEALPRCEAMLREAEGDRYTEGWLLARLASLHTMTGDIAHARMLSARAIELFDELGLDTEVVFLKVEAWRTEMVAGDLGAAERLLREGYAHLSEAGEKYLLSTVAGLLAQTLYELGQLEEMESLVELAEELATEDDVDSMALCRCVRGKLLSSRNRHDEAAIQVREALAMLEPTDAVLLKTGALLDLATVLEHAEDEPGRRDALDEAMRLAAAKGDEPTVRHIRGLFEPVEA